MRMNDTECNYFRWCDDGRHSTYMFTWLMALRPSSKRANCNGLVELLQRNEEGSIIISRAFLYITYSRSGKLFRVCNFFGYQPIQQKIEQVLTCSCLLSRQMHFKSRRISILHNRLRCVDKEIEEEVIVEDNSTISCVEIFCIKSE